MPSVDYSNLFHSGLQAITRRARKRPTSMVQLPPTFHDVEIPSPKRSRRSSISSFSSRFLKRKSAWRDAETSSPKSPLCRRDDLGTICSTTQHKPKAEQAADKTVWITTGGPLIPSDNAILSSHSDDSLDLLSPSRLESIDPFASSPDAKSFILDLTETPTKREKYESFLSFSTSPRENFLDVLPRRERPTSAQTMPYIPSRWSSVLDQYRPESREHLWILDAYECSPILVPQMVQDADESITSPRDDWRQFHIDLVAGRASFYLSGDS